MNDNEFPANEAEIFSAVRVVIYIDGIAIQCPEGGEVDTALEGTDHTFKFVFHELGPAPDFDLKQGHIVLHAGFVTPEQTRERRRGRALVWELMDFPRQPWSMVKFLLLSNIIERLRTIRRAVLVVHSEESLPTEAP